MMGRLRRIAFVLMLLVWSTIAFAQDTGDVPVIGVLRASSATQHDPAMEAIRAELHKLGYTEGQNIRIEQRFTNRRSERLPQLANELVGMKVKVIVAVNEASLRAAMQATSTIPIIVVAYDHDPVASGLIASTNRPGGNVTGIFSRQVELGGKRLELLKEAVRLVELKSPKEFEGAIKFAAKNAHAAILLFSPMIFDYRIKLAGLAAEVRLPTMTQAREFVVAGALMSYAPNRTEVAARTAYFIDRLLRGAAPGDLPVEEAATFKLTLNLKTAKTLGIEIPQSILLRTDEVIK
jgi:ABC-type uncharacterized transport system substrate-binding protein